MEFKKGDKVVVTGKGRHHIPNMDKWIGKTLTVCGKEQGYDGFYKLEEAIDDGGRCFYIWDSKILELADDSDTVKPIKKEKDMKIDWKAVKVGDWIFFGGLMKTVPPQYIKILKGKTVQVTGKYIDVNPQYIDRDAFHPYHTFEGLNGYWIQCAQAGATLAGDDDGAIIAKPAVPVVVSKFNPGDRVKVVKKGNHHVREMDECIDKIFTIEKINNTLTAIGTMGFFGLQGVMNKHYGQIHYWFDPLALKRVRKGEISKDLDAAKKPIALAIYVKRPAGKPAVKWAKGTKLVCIDAKDKRYIKTDSLYAVVSVEEKTVTVLNDIGREAKYFPVRFKKATPAIIKAIEARIAAEKLAAELAVKKAYEEKLAKIAQASKDGFKDLRTRLQAIAGGGVCSFAIQYDDGEQEYRGSAPCHAGMGGGKAGQRIALVESIKNRATHDPAAYKEWVNYHLNIGPRKDCFITKDLDEAFKVGILYNCERPIEELAGAAVALREGSEYPERLKLFKELIDRGNSGNVAYLLCYAINSNYGFRGIEDAHKSLKGDCDAQELFKFFREGYTLTKRRKPYNETREMYSGIARWTSPPAKRNNLSINDFIRGKLTEVGVKPATNAWNAPVALGNKDKVYALADLMEPLLNKEKK